MKAELVLFNRRVGCDFYFFFFESLINNFQRWRKEAKEMVVDVSITIESEI